MCPFDLTETFKSEILATMGHAALVMDIYTAYNDTQLPSVSINPKRANFGNLFWGRHTRIVV
jgi:hypothetical protein